MSLVPYKVTAIKKADPTGNNVLPGASVSIIKVGGGFAQLWDDESGTIVRGNPFQVDANGERQVWLNGGEYSVSVAGGQSWDIKLTGGSDILSIENVAALSTFTPVAGQVYYLKEYNAGTIIGGGELVGSDTGTPDAGLVFSCAGGKFLKRINFDEVCPEFWGAGLTTTAGDDAPTRAALLHPLPCRLRRIYQLNAAVATPDNKRIIGDGKSSTGLIASAGFSIVGTNNYMIRVASGSHYSNFTVDANNADGGAGLRLNCCPTTPTAKSFFVSNVDVKNCTGYGHVTFGSESNPQVTGYYENCHGYNCQVPFEQIGALDVTLVKCTAEGVSGRTLELFHPYAGSKNVTYISCRARGYSGAGINILTTNGYPVGPIRFIDCSIDVFGAVSAVNVERVSGAETTVDLQIVGGSYKTETGSALNLQTGGKYKFLSGAQFIGGQACNMPFFPADVEFNGADIKSTVNSGTAQAFALVVNSASVIYVGGSITAINLGTGGAAATLGTITASDETVITPAASGGIKIVQSAMGSVSLVADGANSFANVILPKNIVDVTKCAMSLSLRKTTDVYESGSFSLTWIYLGANDVRIKCTGLTSGIVSYYFVEQS